jgi:predicted TIM-barrel fold metal-dependent hydrolase
MIIDCDSHITPRDACDYVDGEMTHQRPAMRFGAEGHHIETEFPKQPSEVPGTTPSPAIGSTGSNYDGMYEMRARVRDLERMGVDRQVLIPQFSPWYWSYLIEPHLGTAIAHSYNLSIQKILREFPGKFIGAALVALQDLEGAMGELEWAMENGFKTVVLDETYPVREHPYGEALGTKEEIWPFFAKAEDLGVPIFLHRVQHGHRILNVPKFLKYGMDFFAPDDGQMTVVSLITSGLFDAFPRLRVIHTETGTAWIKPMVEKLDASFAQPPVNYIDENPLPRSRRKLPARAKKLIPPELAEERNKLPPSHYFRNNLLFTIETEEPALIDAVEFLGADRFLFATDYPHDDPGGRMKYRDVEILSVNGELSEAEKEIIRWKNATELFGLREEGA